MLQLNTFFQTAMAELIDRFTFPLFLYDQQQSSTFSHRYRALTGTSTRNYRAFTTTNFFRLVRHNRCRPHTTRTRQVTRNGHTAIQISLDHIIHRTRFTRRHRTLTNRHFIRLSSIRVTSHRTRTFNRFTRHERQTSTRST